MAIDRRRIRRGNAERPSLPWKFLTVASIAIVAQSAAGPARAQALAAGNEGIPRDPWRFTPSLSIDETWSDNINLQPAGAEQSDFVTTISPALRATRYGPRLTATFDYNPQILYYARGSNGSQLRNYLDAQLNATVVENLLFFDALAAISQSNYSPFGTLSANSVNGNSNRVETRTYSFGPTLRSHYGSDFSYSAGYRFVGSSSDSGDYGSNRTNTLFGQFESGTSYRNLGYGADASRTDQSYGRGNSILQETVGGTLTYVLTPTFHLRGRLGYDRNSYPTTGQPDLKGPSYSGGFDWSPSQHTQLNAQVGHRYFGPTANITLRETTARFAITGVYSRDQTTSSAAGLTLVADPNYALLDQFFRATISDPALRAQAVNNALTQAGLSTSPFGTANFLSNQLYLQKLAQLSIAMLGLRNTVTFDVSRVESQALSNVDVGFDVFDQAQHFRLTTYSANWSHKLGPRTNVNVTATKNHNQAIQGFGDTRQRILTASINRQIQKHLSGSVLYRNTRQTGNDNNNGVNAASGNFYSGNYRENAVYGSLRLTF